MPGGRAKLPVLAEISGPAPEKGRSWALQRDDLASLAGLPERLGERRAVLVTGGQGAAGAVAIALAGVASAAGRRTVLLDCDLARPRLAAALGLSEAPGMHEYLRWEASAPELLQPLALAGPASAGTVDPLVFIAAGRPAQEPGTLFGLQSFRHMASKLRHAYELVVLAGPPIGAGNTLVTLAKEGDVVLAGVLPDQAKGRGARAVRAAVRPLGVDALGAVVVANVDAAAQRS